MEIETTLNVCNFYSTDCKGKIRTITENTNIPLTKNEIILVGMKLCQTHYNRFIVNEAHNLEYNKSCSHPKHDIYKTQSKNENKKIYDPDEFKIMLEEADADLIGFFDELYKGTNPNTKSEKTNNNNKKKLVSLCYFLASINNKYINGIKADIGSYLETSGASSSSIDTLANIGLSVSRRTVNRQKTHISENHQY